MDGDHLGAGARLSVVWQAGHVEHSIDTVDHVASYARSLVEALTMAGWQPRRLEVGLRVVPPRVVEIDVRGEVPRLDQASFAKLASVAIASCNLWAALDAEAEIRLRPRLLPADHRLPGEARTLSVEPALPIVDAPALPIVDEPAQPIVGEPPARSRPAAPIDAAPLPLGELVAPVEPPADAAPAPRRGRRFSLSTLGLGRAAQPAAPAEIRPDAPAEIRPDAPDDPSDRPKLVTRVVVALVFGGLLGLFGLPRLSAQFSLPTPVVPVVPAAQQLPTPGSQSAEAPVVVVPTSTPPAVAAPAPPTALPTTLARPTSAPTLEPTPTVSSEQRTAATDAPRESRVLFAQRFNSPLDGWPHDVNGTAWFGAGSYQLAAREPGRFVAVSTPIGAPVGDVNVSGRFRKVGGPTGGGYGFIVRNQGGRLDGDTQVGRYIVLEVGDMGDIGIWQRDETRWLDIMPWTHSNAVRTGGEANELAVSTLNNRLRFVVNGVEVANMTHGSLPPDGGVGVFVGGDMNEVSLEWLIVETPDPVLTR